VLNNGEKGIYGIVGCVWGFVPNLLSVNVFRSSVCVVIFVLRRPSNSLARVSLKYLCGGRSLSFQSGKEFSNVDFSHRRVRVGVGKGGGLGQI